MQESRLAILCFTISLIFSARLLNCMPHPNCSVVVWFISCTHSTFDIPVNFDVDLLPGDTKRLDLECPDGKYCHILRNSCDPIPVRPDFTWIRLHGIDSADGRRPPYAKFLQNVKQHIAYLEITGSRIMHLDAELFRGFRSLTELHMFNSDINAISPDTFQYMIDPFTEVPFVPQLHGLHLSGNNLRSFDWSVLGPVANSLNAVDLRKQSHGGLASLHWSGEDFRISLGFVDHNNLCSRPDCSCCGMKDLMLFLHRINSTAKDSFLTISCGQEYFHGLRDFPHSVPDLYLQCKKGNRTPKSTRSPQLRPSISAPFRVIQCHQAPAINTSCSGSRVSISETNFQTSDAITAIVHSDGTFRCSRILHELHHKAMELGGHSVNISALSDSPVISRCRNGITDINQLNPDSSNARQLMLHTDLSEPCQTNFVRFLDYAQEVISSDEGLPNTTVTGNEISGLGFNFTIDAFGGYRAGCLDTSPLLVHCTKGRVSFSNTNISLTNATTILLRADTSMLCRRVLSRAYEHITQTKNAIVDTLYVTADSVIAACHKGQVVISQYEPERSTETKLKFYSGVNKRCRDIFRGIYAFLRGN